MFVYVATNSKTGKKYIGQHAGGNLLKYWRHCVSRAMSGETGKAYLYAAIRKYGPYNFAVRPLVVVSSKVECDDYERKLIVLMKTKAPAGYNLSGGGEGNFNPSAETRLKLRMAKLGVHHSDEARAKMSATRKGMKPSAETRAKMSASRIGKSNTVRNPWKGPHPRSYKPGHIQPESVRQKISAARMGMKFSEEHRKNISAGQTGRVRTDAEKQKISEGLRAAYASGRR